MPEVGLFATCTPRRLYPLGVSVTRSLRREGCTLWVRGGDTWPGTPIININGHARRDDLHPDASIPTWLVLVWTAHHAERGGQIHPGIGRE